MLRTSSLGSKLLAEWDRLYAIIDSVVKTTYKLSMPDHPRKWVMGHNNLQQAIDDEWHNLENSGNRSSDAIQGPLGINGTTRKKEGWRGTVVWTIDAKTHS